mgnify:CR=1 FL=1
MLCVKCLHKSEVYSTEAQKKLIFRRRRCRSCGHKWHTMEAPVERKKRQRKERPATHNRNRRGSLRIRRDAAYPDTASPSGEPSRSDAVEAREILNELGTLPDDFLWRE